MYETNDAVARQSVISRNGEACNPDSVRTAHWRLPGWPNSVRPWPLSRYAANGCFYPASPGAA
jgi:hypothetical protein